MLPDFRKKQIAVVGDLMLDKFSCGRSTRRSAEDSRAQCVDITKIHTLPGGIATPARCIKFLGGSVKVYGVAGNDQPGAMLGQLLESFGIARGVFVIDGRPTTVKDRIIDEDTGTQLIVLEYQDRSLIPRYAEEGLIGRICGGDQPDAVLLTDFDRGVVTPRLAITVSRWCRDRKIPLIVDARPKPLAWYTEAFPHLDLITPNRLEAEGMLGRRITTTEEVIRAGLEIQTALQCNVLLTLSEHGAWLFEREGAKTHFPATNSEPLCVSGAGDTLAATITLCVAAGMTLQQACQIGQFAAGITVGKPGSEVATYEELAACLC